MLGSGSKIPSIAAKQKKTKVFAITGVYPFLNGHPKYSILVIPKVFFEPEIRRLSMSIQHRVIAQASPLRIEFEKFPDFNTQIRIMIKIEEFVSDMFQKRFRGLSCLHRFDQIIGIGNMQRIASALKYSHPSILHKRFQKSAIII